MSATRLLVLGLVRRLGRAHGYRVSQELLAWDAEKWANTKTGSIYHALRQLTKDGFLTAIPDDHDTSADGARTDYMITSQGEAAFATMMERALAEPHTRSDTLCAGLAFMTELHRDQVVELLQQRLEALLQARDDAERAARRASLLPDHAEALASFRTETALAEIGWLRRLVEQIDRGAYRFAGEKADETLDGPAQVVSLVN